MKSRHRALRGTRDILPEESPRWQFLERTAHDIFSRYGFAEIRTPLLERRELFTGSVGESSDIVSKQMYTFQVGDETISLRPEGTAAVVRAVVEHSLHRDIAAGYPERYYYAGPMFRHERPQKGRQRQFHQIGVEVLGASEALADAETIQMASFFIRELGIMDAELVLNSVGDAACRPAYRERLRAWLEPRLGELCEDCRRRWEENPLRVFDCKVETCRGVVDTAPTLQDSLCEACALHFADVRRFLDAYHVEVRVDARMVRGLDYYERTVFEIVSGGLGAQNAILGGGRYDGLVEALGGPAVPGFGFAIGMERLLLLMPEDRAPRAALDVALVPIGAEAWERAVVLSRRLRENGIGCVMPLVERPMGTQLRRAVKLGARFALILGREELEEGRFTLKELSTERQETLDEGAMIARVRSVGPGGDDRCK